MLDLTSADEEPEGARAVIHNDFLYVIIECSGAEIDFGTRLMSSIRLG